MVQLGDFSFRIARVLSMNACQTGKLDLETVLLRLPCNCTSEMVEIAPKWRVGEGQGTRFTYYHDCGMVEIASPQVENGRRTASQSTCKQDCGTMRKYCRIKDRQLSQRLRKRTDSIINHLMNQNVFEKFWLLHKGYQKHYV